MSQSIVYYIPGWLRTGAGNEETWNSFTATFPDAQHIRWSDWPGNGTWSKSLLNSEKVWKRLVDELIVLTDEERVCVTLVGHSLGARIAVRTLCALAHMGLKVNTAILLGAAIPNDDPDLVVMGRGTVLPVLALCNPMDITLKYIYSTMGGERGVAYGTNGSTGVLENVREIAVPETITDETEVHELWGNMDAAKRLASHHALFYLNALRRFLNGEISGDERILVPQGNVNLEMKVMDAGVWWERLDENEGWKLQKNKLTGHCRILNPNRVRVAWGGETTMRDSFAKISRRCAAQERK